jgi:hypothetical protein
MRLRRDPGRNAGVFLYLYIAASGDVRRFVLRVSFSRGKAPVDL